MPFTGLQEIRFMENGVYLLNIAERAQLDVLLNNCYVEK